MWCFGGLAPEPYHGMQSTSMNTWHHGNDCFDCMFLNSDPLQLGMHGLDVAQARLFFLFTFERVKYSCTYIHWFSKIGDAADKCTGMWAIEWDIFDDGSYNSTIVHLDSVVRLAHLLPIHWDTPALSKHKLDYTQSLDVFSTFYVNKYADHHASKTVF